MRATCHGRSVTATNIVTASAVGIRHDRLNISTTDTLTISSRVPGGQA